jgi:hypothetical protein
MPHIVILNGFESPRALKSANAKSDRGAVPTGTGISDCHVYFDEIDRNL